MWLLESELRTAPLPTSLPIGSMYGIYANIGGILMVNVTIYSIHESYGLHNITGRLLEIQTIHDKSPAESGSVPDLQISFQRT